MKNSISIQLHHTSRLAALLLAAVIAFCTVFPAATPVKADTTFVRVKLSIADTKKLTVSVTGKYRIAETGTEFSGGKLTFTGSGSTVTVSHSTLGELYSGATVTVERENLSKEAGSKLTLTVSDVTRNYLGHLSVTASGGKLQAVNHVPLSHYLYGVVAFEMSNGFPLEALKAQAIAAKNYVVPRIGKSGNYDIGDTSSDQVYKGYVSSYTNVIAAVDATMNDILLLDGAVMPCYFSASNGGYMIKPSTAWKGTYTCDAGYSQGPDEYDLRNLSTPQEALILPTELSEAAVANTKFYTILKNAFDDAAKSVTLPEGAVVSDTIAIRDAVSVRSDGSDSVLFGDGDRVKITAVISYTPAEQEAVCAACTDEPLTEPTMEDTANGDAASAPDADTSDTTAEQAEAPAGGESSEGDSAASGTGSADSAETVPESAVTVEQTSEAGAASEASATQGEASETEAVEAETSADATGAAGNICTDSQTADTPTAVEVPVTFTVLFSDLVSAGLFVRTNLKLFTVSPTDGGFKILHSRYGHGIGLSQRGAQQMAKEGKTYKEIIAFYYGGATLCPFSYTFPEDLQQTESVETPATAAENTPSATDSGSASATTPTPTVTPTAGESTVPGTVNANNTKLRKTASSSGSAIATLSKSTLLTVSGLNGAFYAVRVDATGKVGYVAANSVTLLEDTVLGDGTVNGTGVNIRSGASTKYTSLGKLDKGTAVQVRSLRSGWFLVTVTDTGVSGYITQRYVTLSAKATPPAATTPIPTVTPTPTPTPTPTVAPAESAEAIDGTATASGASTDTAATSSTDTAAVVYGQINANRVNFRAAPSTSSRSYGRYSKGESLIIYEKAGNWYRVKLVSADKEGFVYAKYVTVLTANSSNGSSATNNSGATVSQSPIGTGTINTGLLNLRTAPSTGSSSRVLMSLRRGYTVTVYSLSGSWAYVTYNGTGGYCLKKCIKMNSK